MKNSTGLAGEASSWATGNWTGATAFDITDKTAIAATMIGIASSAVGGDFLREAYIAPSLKFIN